MTLYVGYVLNNKVHFKVPICVCPHTLMRGSVNSWSLFLFNSHLEKKRIHIMFKIFVIAESVDPELYEKCTDWKDVLSQLSYIRAMYNLEVVRVTVKNYFGDIVPFKWSDVPVY